MKQCSHCDGFVPANQASCPHCDATMYTEEARTSPLQSIRNMSWKQKFAATAGAGALMMTLMACYGGPPPCELVDNDKDGYYVCKEVGLEQYSNDCNDNDPSINPAATDTKGDGVDQNCDGVDGVKSAQ